MKLTIIESPYSGDVERNRRYLIACIRDCLSRGESPYASHLMLTEALDDADPGQRDAGIAAGFAWRQFASTTAVYCDLGGPCEVDGYQVSGGMLAGILDARTLRLTHHRHAIEFRALGPDWRKV